MPLQAGDMLHGQYHIGCGGSDYVYHTRDAHVHGDVAIKQLLPGSAASSPRPRTPYASATSTFPALTPFPLKVATTTLSSSAWSATRWSFASGLVCSPEKGGGHLRKSANRP